MASAIVEALFHVGLVPQAPQPQFQGFFGLAVPDFLGGLGPAVFLGAVVLAPPQHLHNVPAVLGLERLADLARLQLFHGVLEGGHHGAGRNPAQVAAVGGRGRIVGVSLCQLSEVLAVDDALAKGFEAHFRVPARDHLVGLDQDMPGVGLGDHMGFGGAAIQQFDDMKAAGTPYDPADIAHRHSQDLVGEDGGQLGRLAPAQAAAASTMRVAVVQGNIEQGRLWDPAFQLTTIRTYRKLSLSVQKDKPDLVVWPESAAPFYFLYDPAPTRLVLEGIRQTSTAYLIGSPAFSRNPDGAVNYYNRAYLIESDGEVGGTYDKAHLVPYGEYTPFKEYLPFIGKMVEHVGDFEPGKKGEVVFLNGIGLGIQICYEIIFPELARAMTRHGAAVLVNITNDAWYGRSAGPYQHFSMVVFRAIENRRSLARAANTGISGFIDPAGRILNSTPLFVESALTGKLPLLTTTTLYTRYGDFFAIACALISLLGIIRSLTTYRKFKFRRSR